MKTYSVVQIAEMLNTNPETIRRWIRDEKLKAVQVSRKDGNIVNETELRRFLKAAPKYARVAASMSALIPPSVGIPIAIGGLIGGLFVGYYYDKNNLDVRVLPEEIEKYLRDNIAIHEENIKRKMESIEQMEKEVTDEKRQIDEFNYLLEHGNFRTEPEVNQPQQLTK